MMWLMEKKIITYDKEGGERILKLEFTNIYVVEGHGENTVIYKLLGLMRIKKPYHNQRVLKYELKTNEYAIKNVF